MKLKDKAENLIEASLKFSYAVSEFRAALSRRKYAPARDAMLMKTMAACREVNEARQMLERAKNINFFD